MRASRVSTRDWAYREAATAEREVRTRSVRVPSSATSTRESSPPRHHTSCGAAWSLPALTCGTSAGLVELVRLHARWRVRHGDGDRGAPGRRRVGRSGHRKHDDGRTSYALQPHAELVREGPNTLISTNQFKNGNHIEVEGTVFKIIEFQHVKPGKGGAFVRTKLRRAADGAVIDRTFRAGEKFRPIHTEARKMQFLYADGTDAHFMDEESFEQIALPETSVDEPLKYVMPNETVDMLYIDGEPADIQLSASVELEVTHTEPGVRGDTASGGGNKPATLETGATVNVPLFVNIGDRIKVDTRSGSYMSRA